MSSASHALFACSVTLKSFDLTYKNPYIANIFTQIGRLEELGSYTYAGGYSLEGG